MQFSRLAIVATFLVSMAPANAQSYARELSKNANAMIGDRQTQLSTFYHDRLRVGIEDNSPIVSDWRRRPQSSPLLVPIPGFVTDAMAFALKPLASNPRFYGRYLRAYLASRSTFYDSSKAARELVYAPRSFDAILEECVEFL